MSIVKLISFLENQTLVLRKLDMLKVINSKWIGTGPITEKFEHNFKIYKQTKFALSVNSLYSSITFIITKP